MSREELIARLMWNSGGTGYGVCQVAGAMLWADDRPTPERPDWISVVAISGPPEKYTDEELQILVDFSEEATRRYDTRWHWRRGANLICIGKDPFSSSGPVSWMRKRMSWLYGPMYSATLLEALAVFTKDWSPKEDSNGV